MSADVITVSFTYSRDEYIRAMRRHFGSRLRLWLDLPVAAFCALFGLWQFDQHGWTLLAMLTFGLSAGLCTMIFYALVVLPALLYRSQPKLKQSYCLEFSQCGIRFKTNAFDSRLQWQVYDRWLADAEFYILYHGKRDLSVIPRRAFAGAAADDEFRELLRHQIGPPIRQG